MNKMILKAMVAVSFFTASTIASAAVWSSLNPSSTPFSYSPTPADAIWHYNGNLTPQNDANIRAEVENVFGLTAGSLFSVSKCDSTTSAFMVLRLLY